MSRLELAADRLKTAIDALEARTAGNRDKGAELEKLHSRMAELEEERERLLTQVAALEEELAALSGVTEEVEQRLDGAIGEIRAALARA
jgi:predicted  nucleic acid-binding Zn-ribbon protein